VRLINSPNLFQRSYRSCTIIDSPAIHILRSPLERVPRLAPARKDTIRMNSSSMHRLETSRIHGSIPHLQLDIQMLDQVSYDPVAALKVPTSQHKRLSLSLSLIFIAFPLKERHSAQIPPGTAPASPMMAMIFSSRTETRVLPPPFHRSHQALLLPYTTSPRTMYGVRYQPMMMYSDAFDSWMSQ
jgi:hypothetical protein